MYYAAIAGLTFVYIFFYLLNYIIFLFCLYEHGFYPLTPTHKVKYINLRQSTGLQCFQK